VRRHRPRTERGGDQVEVAPGFFVTNVGTAEWASDPEVPGTEMHQLVDGDGVQAGMSRYVSTSGPITWTPEQREVAFIVEGSVRIEVAGDAAAAIELGPGDLFTIPAGLETTWHIIAPFKEVWVLAT
jgi:uncharacterized cupin superfamily protein